MRKPHPWLVDLAAAADLGQADVGGKAAVLADLSVAGFPVPPALVVRDGVFDDPDMGERLADAARGLGGERFAVRSSSAAEDLPDASYAGLYESYLNVPVDGLSEAVRRCFAAASHDRVDAYRRRRHGVDAPMAVLVQAMVDPAAAGVAFTAHPVTGDRGETVVTAVAGLAESLVSGTATGEEWTITATGGATPSRRGPAGEQVLAADQARAVAALGRRVAGRYGAPQDIEWVIDRTGRLWLVQARPMTALPDPVSWTPPGPGLWMRNFRLGEWLPEAVTPLFATWLLPVLEDGYLDGMYASIGIRVPFRYALVNGWYYNATPIPTPALLGRVLWHGRRRGVKTLYNALIRVNRDPVAADRAVLSTLDGRWRSEQRPAYRRLVAATEAEVEAADPQRLVTLVDQLGREAGIYLWYLAIVGGSAWKMESRLTRFTRQHLADVLPDSDGGAQVLLRGLPGTRPTPVDHAVQSVDWYHPVAAEFPAAPHIAATGDRHADLAAQRIEAEQRCAAALATRPRVLGQFRRLLPVVQRYTATREEQSRDLTLAWPVLRRCVRRLGQYLASSSTLGDADDVHFCTRTEVHAALTGPASVPAATIAERRREWERQRRLAAPLTLGRAPRLVGDVIEHAVQRARGTTTTTIGAGVLVGHPASAGRATGPVRIVEGPDDFATFTDGDILVAKATAPAWTPLFGRAAAVITDGGTLAAHASLIAREYGIPAVVGTGTATHQLQPGQLVTVDGAAGTVTVHDP